MTSTNQMVSAPSELLEQALDAAAAVGMQDVADELDRILTPSTTQHQVPTAVLWRHREKKPGRVWNYTEHKAVAEIAIRREQEVQGFADAQETERLREGIDKHWKVVCDQRAELDTLRAQLVKRDAPLGAIAGWTTETRAAVLEAFQNELNESASYAWYDAAIVDLMKLVKAVSASAEPSATASCTWTFNEHSFAWDTTCSESFLLIEGGPKENCMTFCCYCSKPIIQAPTSEEEAGVQL